MRPPPDFDPNALLKEALRLHGEGDLAAACMLYRQLLQHFPGNTDLLNVLGTLELQRGDAKKAVLAFGRSLGIVPNQPEILRHRAIGLQNLGRLDEALVSYDKAIALEPDNVENLYARGLVLMAQGRTAEALEAYDRAVSLRPDLAQSYYNRGTVRLHMGKPAEALTDFDQAIAIRNDEANVWINRGTAWIKLQRPQDALADYDRALQLAPDCAEAHANRGDALHRLQRLDEALEAYDTAIRLMPEDAENYYNRGLVLYELKRKEEALASFNAAIVRNPRYSAAYNNRGNVQIDLDQPEEALASLDRAIALDPKNAEAFTNRGNVLRELNRPQEALISFDRAIAIAPDYAEAHANKSVALLHLGDYAEGWKLYEWRWKCKWPTNAFLNFSTATIRQYEQTLWLGQQPLAGRTILLHAEQGYGDTIQFCRYIPLVYAMGGDVIVEAPNVLLPLLQTLKGRYAFYPADAGAIPQTFSLHCPLMSLPRALGTTLETVPNETPYLAVDAERHKAWQTRLGPKTGSRIGLAWSGNPQHTSDRHRSIPLAHLAPLLQLPFEFHAVQKDLRAADAETLKAFPNLHHHGEALQDYADTAALIEEMDLVISVDTSAAHLAGALGKPVWLLLTWVSEWRWLFDRPDTPWYPTAELFRQTKRGDWAELIGRVAERLRAAVG